MNDESGDTENKATAIASLLVLGLGLAALFTGQSWFWLVFVIGFAVVVPIIAILTGESEEGENESAPTGATEPDEEAASKTDALRILRERYARGELSEEQFEAKLDRLLESETFEGVRERREAERELER